MKHRYFVFRLLLIGLLCSHFYPLLAQKGPPLNSVPQECGTKTPSKEVINAAEKAIRQLKQGSMNSIPASLVSIPVKAHIIRRSDGSGGLSEATLTTAIASMNINYQAVNLRFFLCNGVHYMNSDALYDCDVDTENSQLVLNNVNDAINIYFANTLTSGSNVLNGISAFPSGVASENRIIIYNGAVSNGSTLPHEVGHYFYLLHTHETAVGTELVTRGTGANCTTAGDLLCDTPADPCCFNYNASTCTYTGTGVDANGQPYTPLINNLMSYYTECRTQFTSGQYNRMGDGYLYRLSLLQSSGAYSYNCPSVAIAAPTNVSVVSSTACGGSSLISWADNSGNENGFIVERSANATTGFVAIATVAANTTSATDPVPLQGVTSYYRVVAANSMATPSAVAVAAGIACYCQPGITSCIYGDQISNFTLQSSTGTLINNSSTCGPNGYSDFTATSATLTQGTAYTVLVTNPAQYQEGFTVWIDLNQDKTFATSEIVFQSATTTLQGVQQGTFVLPASALPGQTRLRIRQSDNSPGGGVPTTPCGAYPYGETEDYTINLPAASTFESIASGNWSSSTTWATNQLPTTNDEVTIKPPHVVTLPSDYTGKAKKLKLQSKIIFQSNSKLQIGQ